MNTDPLLPETALKKFSRRYLPYLKTALALLILFVFWLFAVCGASGSGGGQGTGNGTGIGSGNGSGSGGIAGNGISGSEAVSGNNRQDVSPSAPPRTPEPVSPDPSAQRPASESSAASAVPPPEAVWSLSARPETPPSGPPVAGSPQGKTGSGGGGGGGFYGEKVDQNQNAVFIVDVSPSMANQALEGTRLEVMKNELRKAIFVAQNSTSPRRGNYFICAYSGTARVFPAADHPWRFGRSKDQDQAFAAINNLTSGGGGTAMNEAWKAAEPLFSKYKINAVYFLTDGQPTDGFGLAAFQSYWAGHKGIRLHCIAIGGESPLLQQIASDAGGKYRVCQ